MLIETKKCFLNNKAAAVSQDSKSASRRERRHKLIATYSGCQFGLFTAPCPSPYNVEMFIPEFALGGSTLSNPCEQLDQALACSVKPFAIPKFIFTLADSIPCLAVNQDITIHQLTRKKIQWCF